MGLWGRKSKFIGYGETAVRESLYDGSARELSTEVKKSKRVIKVRWRVSSFDTCPHVRFASLAAALTRLYAIGETQNSLAFSVGLSLPFLLNLSISVFLSTRSDLLLCSRSSVTGFSPPTCSGGLASLPQHSRFKDHPASGRGERRERESCEKDVKRVREGSTRCRREISRQTLRKKQPLIFCQKP